MSGSKVNDFSIGDSNIQSVMLTLDKTFKGLHQVSLTNYDTTAESQIAAGSVIENNGALYQFTSNESITGSPSDGTVYIRLVPDGDNITAEYTNTSPTWSDSKQGWYGTGTDANKRYLEFVVFKKGALWLNKNPIKKRAKKSYVKAYLSTEQTITSEYTQSFNVNFDTVRYDTNNEFSSNVYTCSKAGYYCIGCHIECEVTIAGTGIKSFAIRKNGAPYVWTSPGIPASTTGFFTQEANCLMLLDVGDTVKVTHTNQRDTAVVIRNSEDDTFIEIVEL